jgi:prepilin signal peptidase PulO-like enzyme (type II secretory pathway)
LNQALTILFGAFIGIALGMVAKLLIQKIDPQVRVSRTALVVCGLIFGAIFAFLIVDRFVSFELRLAFAILCAGLLVQSMIDAYTHRLVRQITHTMAAAGVLILGFYSLQNSLSKSLVSAGICAISGVAISFLTNKFAKGGLGAGDVRLMAVLGWHLGFLSYSSAIWAMFAACCFASIFGLTVVAARRGSLQHRIAFGPFLALGTVTAIFANEMLPSLFIV